MDFKKLSDKEVVRRLVIGLNDQLTLEARRAYIINNVSLQYLVNHIKGFRFCSKDAYDILRWMNEKENRTAIDCSMQVFPSFEGLTTRLPGVLIIEGTIPRSPIFAIVGTRRPDYKALHQAFQLGFESSLNSIACISGMAEGIDQASMRGCIRALAPCYGVLACGHNIEYPALTRRLRVEIIENGGSIISRYSPNTPSFKSNFVSRNMIIAAYSSAIVAIQAPKRSGTLITCDYAIAMNKDVYIGSAGVGDAPCQEGTLNLAYEGAPVLNSIEDLLNCENLSICFKTNSYSVDVLSKIGSNEVRFGDKVYIPTAISQKEKML